MRSFTITLTAPDEPALTRTVGQDELLFTLRDFVAGDLPEGVELTVSEVPAHAAQPVALFA